jgi:hypothetical protein
MIDFAAAVPAGSSAARNDSAIKAATERVAIKIAKRRSRFSFGSGLIDPE